MNILQCASLESALTRLTTYREDEKNTKLKSLNQSCDCEPKEDPFDVLFLRFLPALDAGSV